MADLSPRHAEIKPGGSEAEFHHEKIGKWSLLIQKDIALEEAAKFIPLFNLNSPEAGSCKRVRSSSNARVFLTKCLRCNVKTDVYVKHYLFRSGFDYIKHLFRPGRGKRAFHASLMLRRSGFQAPEPLVLIQKSLGSFKTQAILVTEAKKSAVQLSARLGELVRAAGPSAFEEKRRLLSCFGHLIGRLHHQGIIHGDLRTGNVLVEIGKKGDFSFWFIDNERTRKYHNPPLKLIKKNLVQINMFRQGISNTDRLRFMKAYAGARELSDAEMHILIKHVLDRTRQRLAKKGRI